MSVHTLRIQSTSDWCLLAIQSAGIWARSPGRILSYEMNGGNAEETSMTIDDRVIRISQRGGVQAELTLLLQLATRDDAVSIHCKKSPNGVVVVTSAANRRANEGSGADGNEQDFLLYLRPDAAMEAGATPGDPDLA